MELLGRPEYRPLWLAARRRMEANGLSLDGSCLILRDLAPEEADAIAGLLGVRRPSGGTIRVSLRAVDGALRSSSVGRGLPEVLSELGGPLVDRRAGRALDEIQRREQWAALAAHAAVGADGRLAGWLEQLRSTGLARRLAGEGDARAVSSALDVLAALRRREGGHRLAVLAAEVTGDAHGLDRGRPAGTLCVHALSWLADRPFPQDAADWRRVWSDAGVACDDLSCDVLVLNLPGWPAEPLRLTLRQAAAWCVPPAAGTPGWVFVSENPAVVAAAADHLGDRAPTMLCLDGMPSTAALVVLDRLAVHGCEVRYHGDFDWRGLAIAGVLARKVPATRPWRFGAADYRQALERGLATVALSGRPAPSPWDATLASAMEVAGVAVYEEQVIEVLLDDL
ncbi:MAG: TIGR02679 family protein [Actinobacteria bacterium]|nr:TIGR02679 family protein [Actinomycetota bacterium]